MFKKLLAFACLALSISANATLIDNITYVTDDVAMVDYLKLSNTGSFSWNDVVVNDVLGYIADGWVVTSTAALSTIANGDATAYGLINDIAEGDVATDLAGFGGQVELPETVRTDSWSTVQYIVNDDDYEASSETDYAVSLQRMSVVPIPAAGYLLLSALAGLAGIKRFARKS
jgi:hypothetical protein